MYHEFERAILASVIASGLLASHGVDHGGVEADVIAERALNIGDAILARCTVLDPEPAPPLGNPGDSGSGIITPAPNVNSGDAAGAGAATN